jgi:MYXO-CTERM domain-containing protein
MDRRTRLLGFVTLILGSSAFASDALASWPSVRHDASRSGAADGMSNISAPAVYWKAYLGGTLGSASMLAADVDGNGMLDVVMVSGSRVVATDPTGDELWSTAPLGLTRLAGVADLDGDGVPDVVAVANSRVVVISGADGKVEWLEPAGEMGTVGGVRLADLDGDGLPEVVIRECGCCGTNSGNPGVVYSFAGAIGAPRLLYSMPPLDGCSDGGGALTVVDMDGDGHPELVVATFDTLSVLDGPTGTVIASKPGMGNWTQASQCFPVSLDAAPGDEIVCFVNSSDAPGVDQRRAFVAALNGGAVEILWSRDLAADQDGGLAFVDPVVDLTGDGTKQLVVSTTDATGIWTTRVLDALTGTELATTSGQAIGTIPGKAGAARIATTTDATVALWKFSKTPNPDLTRTWSTANAIALYAPAVDRLSASGPGTWNRLALCDLDRDGDDDLVLSHPSSTGSSPASIAGWRVGGTSADRLAQLMLPDGVDAAGVWVVDPITKSYPQIALERSDGYLQFLDATLSVTNSVAGEQPRPGIPTGGYYAAGGWRGLAQGPIVGQLSSTKHDDVLAIDSRGALVDFNGAAASLVSPPKLVFDRVHRTSPVLTAGPSGAPVVVVGGAREPVSTPPRALVEMINGTGKTIWTADSPGLPLDDIVVGDLAGTGSSDLVFQWGSPSNTLLHTRAISGKDGSLLWEATPLATGCGRATSGIAVADWDGDGHDDVILQSLATFVLSGKTGAKLAQGGPSDCYYMPIVSDVDGNGTKEVLLQGGFGAQQVLPHDLGAPILSGTADDHPFPYGSIALCSGAEVIIEGGWQHPAQIRMTQLAGADVGQSKALVLAQGKSYPSEAAAAADGTTFAQLTSAYVHANLGGDAAPVAALGSNDGWLYLVDPCTGALKDAESFPASVGAIAFGDSDGDGRDEILVSVADGYLYALKQPPIAAPADVLDTDPPHGHTKTDVDEIETETKLYGSWKAVDGATSYRVAVVDFDYTEFLSHPNWIDVGTATIATVSNLALKDGHRYRFAVRAMLDEEPSPDAVSNGVLVHLPKDGTGGAGGSGGMNAGGDGGEGGGGGHVKASGGCGCRAAGDADGSFAAALLLALGLVGARRRSPRTARR